MTKRFEPILIDHDERIACFREAVESAEIVGVDTESDSFYAYREKICLIQVSTRDQDFLIDPFGVSDLSPVRDLLSDPQTIKVFHAAENDIILLRYRLGLRVRNVFDTLIAAQVVGLEQCSLAGLLAIFFEIELSKKEQRSDWRRRPLTEAQVHYAALDTHYLIELRARLLARMDELGRLEEAEWDFQALEEKTWHPRPFRPADFARIKGAKELDPVGVRILRDLYVLRDEISRKSDTAPFRVVPDGALLEVSRRRPRSEDALSRIKCFPRRRRRSFITRVLDTVENAVAAGPLALPTPERGVGRPRFSEDESKVFDALRKWRDQRAKERGVATHRVTKNDLLTSIVKSDPVDLVGLGKSPGMDPWRLKTYGAEILEILEKHRP